jgi:dolichyl-phosphate-mannose--protein O-mannosyl transferase
MQSLWHYHELIYRFHIGLTKDHPYQAHPLAWLIGIRPTAFFYESDPVGGNDCDISAGCSSAITALGNPLIWFGSTLALGYLFYRYARNRERVIGLILLGLASLYLPWLVLSERTVFQFYAVSFQPWMILALVLVLQQVRSRIRIRSVKLSDAFMVAVVSLTIAVSLFFYPINTGLYLPFELWQLRMWLPSWV